MANKKNGSVADIVTSLAAPLAEELGYSLWDVEYVREGAEYYLRITIDSEEGITIDDCETFSRAIDPILDEAGEPTGMYHLAGEFCPEESKVSVAVLDYTRNKEGVEYVCRDENYLKENLEALGTCHVHLEPQPPVYDPLDPSTWPEMPGWDPSIPVDPNQPEQPEEPGTEQSPEGSETLER